MKRICNFCSTRITVCDCRGFDPSLNVTITSCPPHKTLTSLSPIFEAGLQRQKRYVCLSRGLWNTSKNSGETEISLYPSASLTCSYFLCGLFQVISAQVQPALNITLIGIVWDFWCNSGTMMLVAMVFALLRQASDVTLSGDSWLLSASLPTKWFHWAEWYFYCNQHPGEAGSSSQ